MKEKWHSESENYIISILITGHGPESESLLKTCKKDEKKPSPSNQSVQRMRLPK